MILDKINFSSLTHFDMAIITIIGISVLFGLFRGLIKSSVSFVGWIVAFLLSVEFSHYFVPIFAKYTSSNAIAEVASAVVLFLLLAVVIAIINSLIFAITSAITGGILDRSFGLFFGFVRGCLIVSVMFYFLIILLPALNVKTQADVEDKSSKLPSWAKKSESLLLLSKGANIVSQYIPSVFEDKLKKSLDESANGEERLNMPGRRAEGIKSTNEFFSVFPEEFLETLPQVYVEMLQDFAVSPKEKVHILENISNQYQKYSSKKIYYGASKEEIKKFDQNNDRVMRTIDDEIRKYNTWMNKVDE